MPANSAAPAESQPTPTCNANGQCGEPVPAPAPGSQQNTQRWQWGDPVCPVDRVSYTKRVADRILYDLNQIDMNDKVWKHDEKKKVSESVAGIACNLHENWCLSKNVLENAIGGPLSRIGCSDSSCHNPM